MAEDKVRKDTEMEKKKIEKPVEGGKPEEVKVSASESKVDEKKAEDKKEKVEDKKEEKPAEPVIKGKFKEAVVNGKDLRISTKHAVAVCDFIRGKDIEVAIKELEEAKDMKRAIPMKGEIPHRKGKMMSGRYPIKAVKEFIILLKGLRANALYHDLELEKLKISAMANVAARPQKRFGQARFKRSHVQVKLVPRTKNKKSGGKK